MVALGEGQFCELLVLLVPALRRMVMHEGHQAMQVPSTVGCEAKIATMLLAAMDTCMTAPQSVQMQQHTDIPLNPVPNALGLPVGQPASTTIQARHRGNRSLCTSSP